MFWQHPSSRIAPIAGFTKKRKSIKHLQNIVPSKKVQEYALMTAAAQNIKKIANHLAKVG